MVNAADPLTRRAALAALGGALAALPALGRPAAAQTGATFRAINIDTTQLVGRDAVLVRRNLARDLPAAFAGRITGARGAPTLLVRITSLSLGSYTGSASGGGSGGSTVDTDYMEGEALIVPAGGKTPTARVPMLAAVPSASAGAWYLPDNEERRIAYISSFFASWLTKRV